MHDFFNAENEFKTWGEMKISYNSNDKSYFELRQIVNSVPKTWKNDSSNLVYLDHQLRENNRTLSIDKMNFKEIYYIIISLKVNIPTPQIYFKKGFLIFEKRFYSFRWKDFYTRPRKVTLNAYLRSLQYKILNNVLYLNKKTTCLWFIKHTTIFFLQKIE